MCVCVCVQERETGQSGRESLDLPDSVSSAENNIYFSGGCVVSQYMAVTMIKIPQIEKRGLFCCELLRKCIHC